MNNQNKPTIIDPDNLPLIRDTKILNFSTQSSSVYLLNGDYKSKFYLELKNYIDYENDNSIEYISVSMPYVVLCNSNYIINETNNSLKIITTAGTSNYTIPNGNYTANTLLLWLKTNIANFTFTFDNTTNKFTFTSGFFINFTISGTCDYILGFNKTITAAGNNITMPRVCNFLPIPRFNICCDFLSNGTLLGNDNGFNTSTILASVPNNSKNNNLIVYESDANEFILKNLSLNSLGISIMDDNNNLINFNGVSSYFQLRFSIYRKRLPKLIPFNQIVEYASTLNFQDLPENSQQINYSDF